MTTKRRGRPPIEGIKKTPAEYQREYRERKKKTSTEKKAYFVMSGGLVDDLDYLAKLLDMSRNAVVQDLLNAALSMVLPTIKSDAEELQEKMKQFPEASPETIKEVNLASWNNVMNAMKN